MNDIYKSFKLDLIEVLTKSIDLSNILHVSLIGSFGRREAGLKKNDNIYTCNNDIDILIITNSINAISSEFLENKIRSLLDVKWVDIDVFTTKNNRLTGNSMWLVDSVLNNIKLFGADITDFTNPNLITNSLNRREILILWKTRMWTFWSIEFYNQDPVQRNYQLAKLLFSVIDVETFDGSYVSSYKQKKNHGLDIKSIDNSFVSWAYDQKVEMTSHVEIDIFIMRKFLINSFAKKLIESFKLGKYNPYKLYLLLLSPKYFLTKCYYFLRGDLKNSYKDFILYFYETREIVRFLNSNNLEIKNATKIAKKRLLWMEKL
jgi:hypothetical protein